MPGSSAGMLTVAGDYTEDAVSSRLLIEIGGTTPGSEHDVLHVMGQANLAGFLDLTLANRDGRIFVPTPQNTFQVFTADSTVNGTFLNAPDTSGRIVVQDANRLTVGSFRYTYGGGGNLRNLLLSDFDPDRLHTIWRGGNGNWTDANWEISPFDTSGATFPNNAGSNRYHAIVNDGTVTLDQPITVSLLTLRDGALDGGSDLDAGFVSWSGGSMSGTGTTRALDSGNIQNVVLDRTFVIETQSSINGNIGGSGSLINRGSTRISGGEPTISPSLTNAEGATFTVNSTTVNLAAPGTNEGEMRVEGAGVLNVLRDFNAVRAGQWIADGGTVRLDTDVNVISHDEALIADGGQLRIDGGAHFRASSLRVESGGLVEVSAGGTVEARNDAEPPNASIHLEGRLDLTGGMLRAATLELMPDGTLAGTGNVDARTDSRGVIIPGDSPGRLTFGDDLTLHPNSLLSMELTGLEPASGYDQLVVGGVAELGGTLNLQVIDNFAASLNGSEAFNILTSGAPINGSFANAASGARINVNNENLAPVGTFLVSYGSGSGLNPNDVVLSEFLLPQKQATWTGGDGNWSHSNWEFTPADADDPEFPNNSNEQIYHAVVRRPGKVTVDQDISLHVLTIPNNGKIHIAGGVNLTAGTLVWDHQTLIEGDGMLTVGGGRIIGNHERELNSTIRNTGLLTWAAGQVGRRSSAGALINTAGAELEIAVETIGTNHFFAPISVTNENGATIRRDGTGIANLDGELNNAGLVQVDRGVLELDRGISTGDFLVKPGGTLRFDVEGTATMQEISGTVRSELDAANPTAPDPVVHFADGTTKITGTYRVGDTNDSSGGTTVISGGHGDTRLFYDNENEPAVTNVLEMRRGRLGGMGNFEAGTMLWHTGRIDMRGTMTVGGGEIRADSNASLERKLLTTLINTGTLEWQAGNIGRQNDPPGSLINAPSAQLDIALTSVATSFPSIRIVNELGATIRRDGSAKAVVRGPLDNAGLVQVDSATLQLDRGSSTGEFVVNDGGTLQFHIGGTETHVISGIVRTAADPENTTTPAPIIHFSDSTTIVTGTYNAGDAINAGKTMIQGGDADARLVYDNVDQAATTNVLELLRGALDGTGNFEAARLVWQAGRFEGSGTVTVGGGEIRSGSNINERRLETELRNTGLLNWGGGRIASGGGSIVNVSGAELSISSPNDTFASLDADITTINELGSTIRRVGAGDGSAFSKLEGPLDNAGTIIVESGTLQVSNLLQLNRETLLAGTYEVQAGGLLDLARDTITTNQADVTLRGAGSNFPRINALADNQGRFEIHDGRDFETLGDFSNSGVLIVGDMSTFTVNGIYTQTGGSSQLDVLAGGRFQVTQGGFQVQDGAALTGNGVTEAEGEIVIDQGGILAPGASPGTITISDLTFGNGAIYQWELGAEAHDTAVVNGKLTFGDDATLELIDLGGTPTTEDEFVLFRYAPTANDPKSPAWMFDNAAATSWDISAVRVVVDTNGDRVVLTGLGLLGDFDDDGLRSLADIDSLSVAVASRSSDRSFDLTTDGQVDRNDLDQFLSLVDSRPGDADLDGTVGFPDFISLANHFGEAGVWSQGDFDGTGDVLFPDFVILSNNFGKTGSVGIVPEPGASMLLLIGIFWLARRTDSQAAYFRRIRNASVNCVSNRLVARRFLGLQC